MQSKRISNVARLTGCLSVIAAAVALTVAPVSAAPAPVNCNAPDFIAAVQMDLALQSAQNITMSQGNGGLFYRDITARVMCLDSNQGDLGEIPNSVVSIWTNVPSTTVNGQPANDPNHPVQVNAPDGFAHMQIISSAPDLTGGAFTAKVGQDTMWVYQAFNQLVPSGWSPIQIGNVWASTPEMDSVLLFGSGAAGMVSYALLRRRASRK